MDKRKRDKKANKMYAEYSKGFSLAQVGKMFGSTRQSVYSLFKNRNYKLREKKKLSYLFFNGKKYSLRNMGYYGLTKGKRNLMHRDVWEFHNGKIPVNHDLHHINKDRTDNRIENLELYTKEEHARKFVTGNNQFTKKIKVKT